VTCGLSAAGGRLAARRLASAATVRIQIAAAANVATRVSAPVWMCSI
jgi:hypothetical protein